MAIDSPDSPARQCTQCGETKSPEEFRFAGGKRPRFRSRCRICEAADAAEIFKRNGKNQPCRSKEARQAEHRREAERAGRPYRTAQEIASPENREAVRERARATARAYEKAHRKENAARKKEREIAQRKAGHAEYLAANPEIRHYECKSQQEFDDIRMSMSPWLRFQGDADQYRARYEFDSEFREKECSRTTTRKSQFAVRKIGDQLRDAINRNGDSPTMHEFLGYSIADLKLHLEEQFTANMSWEAFKEGNIHIDHIVPLTEFDVSNPVELRAAWQLSNLHPLWWNHNLKKAAKNGG